MGMRIDRQWTTRLGECLIMMLNYASHLGFRSFDAPLFPCSAGSVSVEDQIYFTKKLGFVGVQDAWHCQRTKEEQVSIAVLLKELNLRAGCIVCGLKSDLNDALWLPTKPSEWDRLWSAFDVTVEAALALGSDAIAVISGDQVSIESAEKQDLICEALLKAADKISGDEISLVLENIAPTSLQGMYLKTFAQTASIVESVNCENVGLIFDSSHVYQTDGDIIANLDRYRRHVKLVQIANCPARSEPAIGDIDLAHFIQHLAKTDYQGLVELEHGWVESTLEAEKNAIDWLKNLETSST